MMTHADSAYALTLETLWHTLRAEADFLQKTEPVLGAFLQNGVLWENSFSGALCRVLAGKLASTEVSLAAVHAIFTKTHQASPELAEAAQHDLLSVMEHD